MEDKIKELECRIAVLEKKERKRETRRLISILIKICIYGVIIFTIYKVYNYVNNNYIIPYKDVMDKIEKIDSDSIKEWFNKLKD